VVSGFGELGEFWQRARRRTFRCTFMGDCCTPAAQ
jgi:hypothetical protein